MVQRESPSADEGTVPAAECQAPRLLQLLRSERQLRQPERVLPSVAAAASEVAESAQSATELHLGQLLCSERALRTGPTPNRRTPQSLLGDRAMLSLRAAASIHEEPGAGKLHAGICAGAVA